MESTKGLITLDLPPYPSARYGSVRWTDKDGKTYLFGGLDGNYLNDLFLI